MTKVLLCLSHGNDSSYHIARPGATTIKGETQLCWVDAHNGSVIWTPDGPHSITCETWPIGELVETYQRHWEREKAYCMTISRPSSPRAVKLAKKYLDLLTVPAVEKPGLLVCTTVAPSNTRFTVRWSSGGNGYVYRHGDYQVTFDEALAIMVAHVESGGKEPVINNPTE